MARAKLTEMWAISIQQPWAHMILYEGKNVENRSRVTHFRGTVAIHASKGIQFDDSDARWLKKRVGIVLEPVSAKGALGFWRLKGKTLAECLAQMSASRVSRFKPFERV